MARVADRVGPERTAIVRLLAVATILAAMLLMLVPLCGDGMFAGMSIAPVATATDTPSGSSPDVLMAAQPVGPVADSRSGETDASGMAGMPGQPGDALLAACLAVFAAVVVTVLGLVRPRPARMSAELGTSSRWPVVFGRPPKCPALADLCVLRT